MRTAGVFDKKSGRREVDVTGGAAIIIAIGKYNTRSFKPGGDGDLGGNFKIG